MVVCGKMMMCGLVNSISFLKTLWRKSKYHYWYCWNCLCFESNIVDCLV